MRKLFKNKEKKHLNLHIYINGILMCMLQKMRNDVILYDRSHRIWDNIKDNEDFKGAEIEAKCYLSYDYPKLHPVQGDDRQDLWNAICDAGWNRLYDDGVSLTSLSLPRNDESFESFIGMDDGYNNWNEGLDRELTKDLHLTSAFHNLFERFYTFAYNSVE